MVSTSEHYSWQVPPHTRIRKQDLPIESGDLLLLICKAYRIYPLVATSKILVNLLTYLHLIVDDK